MQTAAKAFVTVWPPYIDAEKTLPEGRRIPKEMACECVKLGNPAVFTRPLPPNKLDTINTHQHTTVPAPNVHDIAEAVSSLGLPCLLEAVKRYPRDPFAVGRVRVSAVLVCFSLCS